MTHQLGEGYWKTGTGRGVLGEGYWERDTGRGVLGGGHGGRCEFVTLPVNRSCNSGLSRAVG